MSPSILTTTRAAPLGAAELDRRDRDDPLTTPREVLADLHESPLGEPAHGLSELPAAAQERQNAYSGAWQTASTLFPSGSRTKAP